MKRILAVTGHRPDKLLGYDGHQLLTQFAIERLTIQKPTLVLTGMALGWDTAIAEACSRMGIKFHAYVPFDGQEKAWPQPRQVEYKNLLAKAEVVKIVNPGEYSAHKMQLRNVAMVNNSQALLALWDGSTGGTCNCVHYALDQQGYKVLNSWTAFTRFKAALKKD